MCVCFGVLKRKIEGMCVCVCVCVHVCSDAMAQLFDIHTIKGPSVTPVCACVCVVCVCACVCMRER